MNQHVLGEVYERHVDNIYRLCYSYMRNPEDARDALQTTFLKLLKSGKEFESVEHEKAWLIVTAGNTCKDLLKSWWKKHTVVLDDALTEEITGEENRALLEELMKLPANIRISLYLHYYEGYSSEEIGRFLKKSSGTVRGYLKKGREILRERFGE